MLTKQVKKDLKAKKKQEKKQRRAMREDLRRQIAEQTGIPYIPKRKGKSDSESSDSSGSEVRSMQKKWRSA